MIMVKGEFLFCWKCTQKHCMSVSEEKVYMLHNIINQGHQPTMIILGHTVRDINICKMGGFYRRVVEDSGLMGCDTALIVKCHLTNSCILYRPLSF